MADYKAMRAACAEAKGGRIAARAGIKAGSMAPPARTGTNHAYSTKAQGYADGGAVDGGKAKGRADRKGGHRVAVNVIVAPQGQGQARPVPVPVPAGRPAMGPPPPMPGAGLGAGPPPGGMPPGGPPGMRPPGMNKGGAITAGAGGGEGRLQKAKLMKHRDGAEDRDIGAAVA